MGDECSHHYATFAPPLGTDQGRREKFRGRSRALYKKALKANQNYPAPAMQAIPDDESNKYINLIVHSFIICIFENIFLKCISTRRAKWNDLTTDIYSD